MAEMTSLPVSSQPGPESEAPKHALPTFDALPLSSELRETLTEMGYHHPTPVQLAVWEPATRGRDAVVQARTGTGKTAAFGLPIVDQLVKRSLAHPQVLALCPTRELALQVAAEIERLSKRKSVRVTAIYGGAPMQRQIDAIEAGAQVVVGTPGRVLDHLRRGTLSPKGIRMLVLDEADEMLSMGFERELTAILDQLPRDRQTLLFSATLPPDIERIAKNRLRSPEFITLSGDHIGALEIQHFVYMTAGDKVGALVQIIEVENPESAVIFCNTREATERVAQSLSRRGFDADWLNGDLPQSDREKVMAATRGGQLRFLVATDVAARGIDISHLTHVINFDFPQDAEAYVHRTGRTGRAGRTGTAISLIAPPDIGGLYLLRLTYKIRPIERQIPTPLERQTRAEADLVAMLVEAFAGKATHPDDLALARRLLTHDDAERIVAGLLRDHLGARPNAPEEAAAARRANVRQRRPWLQSTEGAQRGDAAVGPKASSSESKERRPEPRFPRAPDARATREPAQGSQSTSSSDRSATGQASEPQPGPLPTLQQGADLASNATHANPDRSAGPRARSAPEHARPRGERGGPDARRLREQSPLRGPTERAPRQGGSGSGTRHADFANWQPPVEEGDDQPILGEGRRGPPHEEDRRNDKQPPGPSQRSAPRVPSSTDMAGRRERRWEPAVAGRAAGGAAVAPEALEAEQPGGGADASLAEIFINVGRRDGVRAADLQRALQERGSLDKEEIKRIRVRERNAFVSVRKEIVDAAVTALTGATIGGKAIVAEPAREKGSSTAPELSGAKEVSGALGEPFVNSTGGPISVAAEPGAAPVSHGARSNVSASNAAPSSTSAAVGDRTPDPTTAVDTTRERAAHPSSASDDDQPSPLRGRDR